VDQLRADACAAAHRRAIERPRPVHRSADRRHCAKRAGSERTAARISGRPRGQGQQGLSRAAAIATRTPMTEPRSPTARYRALTFGVTRAVLRDGAPGTQYLRAEAELQPFVG